MSKDNYNIDSIMSEVKKRREENEKEIRERALSHNEVPQAEPVVDEPTIVIKKEEEPAVMDKSVVDNQEGSFSIEEEKGADTSEQGVFNLTDFSAEPKPPVNQRVIAEKRKHKKKKKVLKSIVCVLLVLIIGVGTFAGVYFNGLLDDILDNKSDVYGSDFESDWKGMDEDVENFQDIYETEASELASLQDMMKTWYYNGVPASASKVLNVLLIGEDTRGTEIRDDGTRADSAIICSINTKTGQITLTSILRDAYAYFETEPHNEESGKFSKINAAMSLGNINAYINCVESLYKIDIDNYVIVNFDSFEKIVDTLGGVTLEITEKEINEINNHQVRYNHTTIEKTFEGTKGEMKLTGKQALAYCRIRKIDSDNKRADRQKTTLIKIFEEAKKASATQTLKLVKDMIPYVSTGFSKGDIIKIAKYALTENWLSYKTQMASVPEANLKGGMYYGAWCWKCDYPQDAYNLQMKIYGKSNITLAHTRVDTARCREKGFRSEGVAPVGATIRNESYGEVTTSN